jgi:hypothetical protein
MIRLITTKRYNALVNAARPDLAHENDLLRGEIESVRLALADNRRLMSRFRTWVNEGRGENIIKYFSGLVDVVTIAPNRK